MTEIIDLFMAIFILGLMFAFIGAVIYFIIIAIPILLVLGLIGVIFVLLQNNRKGRKWKRRV